MGDWWSKRKSIRARYRRDCASATKAFNAARDAIWNGNVGYSASDTWSVHVENLIYREECEMHAKIAEANARLNLALAKLGNEPE